MIKVTQNGKEVKIEDIVLSDVILNIISNILN